MSGRTRTRYPAAFSTSEGRSQLTMPDTSHLSSKDIPVDERLILALDVPSYDEAMALVDMLGDTVKFYKLGLELFVSGDYHRLADELVARGIHVFADLKMFDVPITVSRAIERMSKTGIEFVTIHGNEAMLEAACAVKGSVKVLAVTVLTSLDEDDMKAMGFKASIAEVVLSRAYRALAVGCDGVISSGLEAPELRKNLGHQFIIVTPGIRPGANKPDDDQKRTVDVEEAFHNGADYIVVGRPIHGATDPKAAAEAIQERIATLFR